VLGFQFGFENRILYCGWLRNPAPVEIGVYPIIFIGLQPSKVVHDFFHPQYHQDSLDAKALDSELRGLVAYQSTS
jgi:hypothetical protein